MTRSKLELATILVKLRGDDSNAAVLAKEMSLYKLCSEIQKIEDAQTVSPPEQVMVEDEPVVEKKKNKHIFSWLLDSDSE